MFFVSMAANTYILLPDYEPKMKFRPRKLTKFPSLNLFLSGTANMANLLSNHNKNSSESLHDCSSRYAAEELYQPSFKLNLKCKTLWKKIISACTKHPALKEYEPQCVYSQLKYRKKNMLTKLTA